MKIEKFILGMLQTNCYLIIDEESGETAVIDPGFKSNDLIAYIMENSLKVKYIIMTHGHFDHISGANSLKNQVGGKMVICEAEREFLNDDSCTLLNMYGDGEEKPIIDMYVKENDTLNLGDLTLSLIETPGHTIGGMSVIVKDALFCGDTLFFEGVGRCDLKTGSLTTLVKTIKEKLFVLNDETRVFCGHGENTTIGYEKAHNPYVSYEG